MGINFDIELNSQEKYVLSCVNARCERNLLMKISPNCLNQISFHSMWYKNKASAFQPYDTVSVIYKVYWASLIASRVCVSVHPTPPHFIPVAPAPWEYSQWTINYMIKIHNGSLGHNLLIITWEDLTTWLNGNFQPYNSTEEIYVNSCHLI